MKYGEVKCEAPLEHPTKQGTAAMCSATHNRWPYPGALTAPSSHKHGQHRIYETISSCVSIMFEAPKSIVSFHLIDGRNGQDKKYQEKAGLCIKAFNTIL